MISNEQIIRVLTTQKEFLQTKLNQIEERFIIKGTNLINYYDSCDRNKYTIRQKIQKIFESVNSELMKHGLSALEIRIGKTTQQARRININVDDQTAQDNNSKKVLFFKDYCNISDRKYTIFRLNLAPHLPVLDDLLELRKNQMDFMLYQGRKFIGINVADKIYFNVKNFFSKNRNIPKIRLKLCGDGVQICRTTNLFNFNFSIIEEEYCMSPYGHYILGQHVIKKEEYDELSNILKEPLNILLDIKHFDIDGKQVNLEFFLGGDLKALLIITGTNSANSDFCCLYCHYANAKHHFKKNTFNLTKFLTEEHKIERTFEHSRRCRNLRNVDKRLGYQREPITEKIGFDHIMIDPMHLFIRISEVLFECHITNDLLPYENITTSNPIIENLVYIKVFSDFLTDKTGKKNTITFVEKKFQVKSFTAHDIFLIFLGLNDLFDALLVTADSNLEKEERIKKIRALWGGFFMIYLSIKNTSNNPYFFTVQEMRKNCKKFLIFFVSLYPVQDVTPYIHILANHVAQLIELHGNVYFFNQEGHEKFNHLTTINYFQSTNKKEFVEQLVKKCIRLEDGFNDYRDKINIQQREKKEIEFCPDYFHSIDNYLSGSHFSQFLWHCEALYLEDITESQIE